MQHLPQGVKDEEGCFVYEVIGENRTIHRTIQVRADLDVGDETRRANLEFESGQLVSIDRIQPSRASGSNNGPFLRLSDGSGWLFEHKYGERWMRRVAVETGLFVVYVDNYPVGQALRKHPVDRSDMHVDKVAYLPMQKLYCDRKVKHRGVTYYRVQGTEGWVFDVRPHEDGDVRRMLLDETMVKTGLFAFQSLARIAIRNCPNVGDEHRTLRSVKKNEIFVVDVIREAPATNANGPFLRLADGSGWLFEHKNHEKMMEEVKVEQGKWSFRVKNQPAGIGLRSHPIDSQEWLTGVSYKPGELLICDRRIRAPTGVHFFRVKDADGWVFDKRDGRIMMELLESSTSPRSILETDSRTGSEWSPDFVRGVAEVCIGLEEISHNPTSRVISFRNAGEGVRINVYYTTRTIGTALDHPAQGKTQLFRRNCSNADLVTIMNDPRVHTDKGYQRKRARTSAESGFGPESIVIDGEEEARNALLECDYERAELSKKRKRLLSSIRAYDMKRCDEATSANQKRKQRNEEQDKKARAILQAENERRAELERKERTCQHCYRVFASAQACAQHVRDAHGFVCDYCDREFSCQHSLNQHRDAVGHW